MNLLSIARRYPRNQARQQLKIAMSSASSSNKDEVVVTQTSKQQRRRRRQHMVNNNIPSYKEFVHRFTVVSLYRNCLKAIKLMPQNAHGDLKLQVQRDFRAYQTETDTFSIQRALADGQRRYQELQELTGYKKDSHSSDADSWINTKDSEDPRGRVGAGWPWNR
jgi:hypothetical protein